MAPVNGAIPTFVSVSTPGGPGVNDSFSAFIDPADDATVVRHSRLFHGGSRVERRPVGGGMMTTESYAGRVKHSVVGTADVKTARLLERVQALIGEPGAMPSLTGAGDIAIHARFGDGHTKSWFAKAGKIPPALAGVAELLMRASPR